MTNCCAGCGKREGRQFVIILFRGLQTSCPTGRSTLQRDVAKEEDGLCPASLTALSGDEWDVSMAAWRAAHPRESES
ncbi:hypothetical protein ACFRU3_35535 [Streptomyces sp. NPDC056910]|uniref:hypothetical protein n=1 Tax=Streptomyces sp. NPDC056910 TaxID=3345964 RepID=UPI0036D11F39